MKNQHNSDFIICVRKRPAFTGPDVITTTPRTVSVMDEKLDVALNKYSEVKTFEFDRVFPESEKTFSIYFNNIKKYIEKKQNFICYTFGETGSGKTYTLFGNGGLIELSLYKLIDLYKKVVITSFEIYKNQVYDLINKKEKVLMLECDKEINIPALQKYECSEGKVYDVLKLINRNRIIGESSQNESSSRSHVVINIRIDDINFVFVDLAGSEKGSKSICTNRTDHYEMAGINKDIFALKECMRYMKANNDRIPFRSSKLTMALRESFYDHYNTLMIVAVSPEKSNIPETINILTCANDFKTVRRKIKIEKEKEEVKLPQIRLTRADFNNEKSYGYNNSIIIKTAQNKTITIGPHFLPPIMTQPKISIPFCNPPTNTFKGSDTFRESGIIKGFSKYDKLKYLLIRETSVCKDYLTLTNNEKARYSYEFGNKMAGIMKDKIGVMKKIDNSFYKKY